MANTLIFQNKLTEDLNLYDSFSNDDGATSTQNYYGTLTLLGSVKSASTASVTALRPMCAVIAFDTSGHPVGRYVAQFGMGVDTVSLTIQPADLSAVQDAGKFLTYISANPSGSLAAQFNKAIQTGSPSKVDNFFSTANGYTDCTFVSYMLALTDRAKNPPAPSSPASTPETQTYSLSQLCNHMGGKWPPELPDIAVENFYCSTANGVLALGGTVDVKDITFQSSATKANVLTLLSVTKVQASFSFTYSFGPNSFGTNIQFVSNDFKVPMSGGDHLVIASPTVSIQFSPISDFGVFKASAAIPFNIFQHTFEADIIMVIDNVEAEISAQIKGDNSSLPAPPPMKGVHFDEFGVGMGLVFTPPSYVLGLQGQFHIGDNTTSVALGDSNKFALVCAMDGDWPNPLYISFYVPAIDFPTLVEVFTDAQISCNIPIMLQDLSFQWSENPREPLVLPDGSLTEMAFGCNGYLQLFDLPFYGSIQLESSGAHATLALSPLQFGNLLQITGNGQGVSLKVDPAGNPIDNTQLPTTAAAQQALAAAPTKQFVASGGPQLIIDTSSSPYFSLGAAISLFEIVNESVSAQIDNDGIHFDLDYGGVIESQLVCNLQSFHTFAGSFTFRLDLTVPLPAINNFSLGNITLNTSAGVGLTITTSTGAIDFQVTAEFTFEGERFTAGPYAADVNLKRIGDLLTSIEHYIVAEAKSVFDSIVSDATKWASYVQKGFVTGESDVAVGLKTAYDKSINEVSSIMHDAGYSVNEATSAIKSAFNASASQMAGALTQGYKSGEQDVASALKAAGYGAQDVAGALSSTFGSVPGDVKKYLQAAGYTTDQIKSAFKKLGGSFESFARSTWKSVSKDLNPKKWK